MLTGPMGMVIDGNPEYRAQPLTVECRAKLNGKQGFNVLIACDTKVSSEHWELYSSAGSGDFRVYQPGRGGDVQSSVDICDGVWHDLAAILEPNRVRLFVDGKLVTDAAASAISGAPVPGALAIGALVEGGIGCDGSVQEARISRGTRQISPRSNAAFERDAQTILLWHLDNSSQLAAAQSDPWAVEDAQARAALPEFKVIPAAGFDELTPATGWPRPDTMTNWNRSLGDATCSRYSALSQINRKNVKQLALAWIYHSKDGAANIQCNPIIVGNVMFAPTAGNHIVALNAETGAEVWRFAPEMPQGGLRLEDAPARRGLVYWPGEKDASERILFTVGNWIYALDPKTGAAMQDFGKGGRAYLPTGGTVAGAFYKRTFVIAGFGRDVFGYDIVDGRLLWTFHTIPHPGEFGYDTWRHTEQGANCWGGMALDEQRGIAYVSTGSPKPNMFGGDHKGENLFGNCVIALDALTGKRLWHFQEIRHDIWDLDIPAPPNLVTVTHDGRRVDALAQVTKMGNTLLLDRTTGKPLFPVRLRRAPTSKLPGEWTAPYQPDLELPQPFARQRFSGDDITTRTKDAHDYVLKRINSANMGWFEPFEEGKPTVYYGIHGGAEWTGAAFDPTSGCLYISANELPWVINVFRDDAEPRRDPKNPTVGEKIYQKDCAACHGVDRIGVGVAPPLRGLRHRLKDADVVALWRTGRGLMPPAPPMSGNEQKALLDYLFLRDGLEPAPSAKPARPAYTFAGYTRLLDQENYPGCKPPWGTLNCLDLNTGKIRWKVPLGEYPELTAEGIPKTGTENFGGPMVTAGGLVFCSGTRDDMIRAFDKGAGVELWKFKLPLHGTAAPATYSVNGRQYIVIAAAGGGKLAGPTGDAYVAFALPRGDGQ
jgi:quinoprotein glucose dehydrogenase